MFTRPPLLLALLACVLASEAVLCTESTPAIATIAAAQLKPEVLYIDLASPGEARGIALADDKQAANLEQRELGGMVGALPKDGRIVVKLDPAIVKPETPLLVAFCYFDTEAWAEPAIAGFLHAPDPRGFYTNCATDGGAYSESWRWWTTFTYANYRGIIDAKQANFRLGVKAIRWVLVLPLAEAAIQQMSGIRECVLAMLADYSRLLVAEAALQETRARVEQALNYRLPGAPPPPALTGLLAELKAGAGQARVEMDQVIMEVLAVTDPAYLGLYDGQPADRAAALAAFHQKVQDLAQRYRALAARAREGLAAEVAAQIAQARLQPATPSAPARIAPDRIITPQDIRDRLFWGMVNQVPLRAAPQVTCEAITRDQGIDSVYDYSLSNWVKPQEDGSYDFSALDKVLGTGPGVRVELGMHNIPLPDWARKRCTGEVIAPGTRDFKYGGFRIKAADGRWDGYFAANGNDNSFPPSGPAVWSRTLFEYSCDFYRAIGTHFRESPLILRYTLNSEGGPSYVGECGYVFDSALPFYHDHLRRRFGTLAKLNEAFGSAYKGFDDIPLPRVAGEKSPRLTPAYYEYTQLCIERAKQVREAFARALHETDPNHAVGEVQSSLYGGNVYDSYTMAANTAYDTFAAGDSATRAVRYQYSLNRYQPKPIWMYEPYTYSSWTAPEGKGYRVEETSRRMLTANLWTWFFWGHQGLPFFNQRSIDFRSDITDFRLADIMLWPSLVSWNPRRINPTLRLAAGSLGALKPVQERLVHVLRSAPAVPARIGLFESSTTHRVPYPTSGTFLDVGQLQGRLEQERKHFCFVPETALVEGKEPLDGYRVIVAAYATHLRPEARDALLNWVQQGGVLIGSGPTGLYDHYGRSDANLPRTVFGMDQVEYRAGITEDSKVATCTGALAGREGISLWANRDFCWRLPARGLAEGTRVLAALADGTPVAVERPYGKGKVVLTAASIGSLLDLYWPLVMAEINAAQPVPEASASSADLALLVRESATGVRYLSVVNGNISAPVEATITVAGEFTHPRDLTLGEGWVIPAVASGGVTQFRIWMASGMGSFIELGTSRTRLSGLSREEETARLALGRYGNLLARATAWGLSTVGEQQQLAQVEQECAAGRLAAASTRLGPMTATLSARWFEARADKVVAQAQASERHPVTATWAHSYAAIAQQLLRDGKLEAAQERLERAEQTLAEAPPTFPPEVTFPYVRERLDLKDLAGWPQADWQTVYKDRKARRDELGQFILVGSPEGLYLGARVKAEKVTDRAVRPGLPWRVMDGVVLHLRGLDTAETLSNEFRSEDTYEITCYVDGSVFVWDNLLPCDAMTIRSVVTRTPAGYTMGAFIPAAAVRLWPRPGVTVISDVCLYTAGHEHTEGYWHGTYAQANTWARVGLGALSPTGGAPAPAADPGAAPADLAQPCLRVEHWGPQATRGVGRATATLDPTEVLPGGKRGAIRLTNGGQGEEVQLMTEFEAIAQRPGLRVWLKGTGSGGKIELRVTGREGYTWQMVLKDKSVQWRPVDFVLDRCQQTREDVHFEVLNGFQVFRPRLDHLIVRFALPAVDIKVGAVEYLTEVAR